MYCKYVIKTINNYNLFLLITIIIIIIIKETRVFDRKHLPYDHF